MLCSHIPHRGQKGVVVSAAAKDAARNARSRTFIAAMLSDERGSAILEFAISLPLLVVFVVGIYDFSGAFNQKQKIDQAAQEGAILAGAQPMTDIAISNPSPTSLLPVVTSIVNSLIGSGVVNSSCTPPGVVTQPVPPAPPALAWTYTISDCPKTLVITINRGWISGTGTLGSPASVGSTVTIGYPYQWQFNSVIQLLIPGANYSLPTTISESATVHNQM